MLDVLDVVLNLDGLAATTIFEEHEDQADETRISKDEDNKCLRLQHERHHTKVMV